MRKDDCRAYPSSFAYLFIVAIFLPGTGLPVLRSRLSQTSNPQAPANGHTFGQSGC